MFNADFWRYSSESDLGLLDKPWSSYFKAITEHGAPPEFAIIVLKYNPCGVFWQREFIPRSTKLRVVVIENISAQSISLEDFVLRERSELSFRTIEADSAALKTTSETRRRLLPQRILRPGEKLLVPLYLISAFDDDDDRLQEIGTNTQADVSKASEQLTVHTQVTLSDLAGNSHTVPADKMLTYLGAGLKKPDLERKYIFGPSAQIESVYVGNIRYPFRQRDEKQFVLLSEMEGGSCPYLYTRANNGSKWVRMRHILYGSNSAQKERTDVTSLRTFDGSIMISEEDPEISHIDLIEIVEKLVSGKERILPFADALTSRRDQRRFVLKQGEKHIFRLKNFQPHPGARYFVRSVGYYEPY